MTGTGKTVTRVDLCEAVYQKVGLSRTESSAFVELVLKEITDCLEKGETVKLSSFGSFMVRKKGQRIGRNPKTGTEVPISPRRVMVFKPSAILKQRINGHSHRQWRRQQGRRKLTFVQLAIRTGSGHLDKAPDAFRTISEVADDLDIPQHVLRFWETRFTQIKPMKRSGGRRYYRPDDVDLLRGIRRLLYGEGYTIRGVQRILKEHGIGSVQRLADASAVASFGAIEEAVGRSLSEQDEEAVATPGRDLDDDDYEAADGIDFRLLDTDEDGMPALDSGPIPGVAGPRPLDVARLQNVLADLIACRQLLDPAMKDG